jgi:hypothetical protein
MDKMVAKWVTGFVIAVLMCAPTWPVAGAAVATGGKCGDNLTWFLDRNGAMTIRGSGEMYDYSSSRYPFYFNGDLVFSMVNNITVSSVVIEDGVTSVGKAAFAHCDSLTSVVIPNSVMTIGNSAFYGCPNLTIYGGSGSAAESCANDSGIPFAISVVVLINGAVLLSDVPPQIINERTLVPFRAIFEAVNAFVEWNGKNRIVTAALNETIVSLTIGETTAYVNGQAVELDVPPKIINGRTLVPLRFIAENSGFQVYWNADTQTAEIWREETADGGNFPSK